MRWQRAARWGVAAAGLAVAVTLYVQMRERPVDRRPPPGRSSDPVATIQSTEGTITRVDADGRILFELKHAGAFTYPDGRVVWKNPQFRVDDGTFLSADEVEGSGEVTDGMPSALRFRGNVRMDTSEGASIGAAEASYTHATGVAVLPGAVTFVRGAVSGGGTNGEYDRNTGVFHLLADATVTSKADAPGEQVHATATSMTFNRAGLALLLEQDARITHPRQVMTADRATLYLAEDQESFRVIELRGNARVDPAAGQESTVPAMRGADIDMAFHAGTEALERAVLVGGASLVLVEDGQRRAIDAGEISITTAPDGRTISRLEGRGNVVVRTPAQSGQPARTITAARLIADGDDVKGLTGAVFSGGARFVESVPASGTSGARERTGTSRTLTMRLGGNLDAVEQADFDQDVTFRDGEVTGDADLGTYMAAEGQLTLRPARMVRRAPRVVSGRVTVDARESIDVDLETRNLHAVGDVKTLSTGEARTGRAGARGASSRGLFDQEETMLGFASEFWYEDAAGTARYTGTEAALARVTQGETEVVAVSIELDEQTRDRAARGRVDSRFVAVAEPADAAPPKRYRVTAETLEYREEARTATYGGKPVTMRGPDGETTSQTLVLTLAEDGRRLLRLDARVDVHATLPEGREALADTLLYEADLSRYTLRGQPLVLRGPGEKAGACSLWRARTTHFTTGAGSPEFPPNENPGSVHREDVSCTGALQK